jgi:large subunit ribosomal protein L29
MVIGHVDNPLQKRNMRRQIARLNTLIHQHDLAAQKEAK